MYMQSTIHQLNIVIQANKASEAIIIIALPLKYYKPRRKEFPSAVQRQVIQVACDLAPTAVTP